jgi:Ca2+-binding RTX toxin-like protein
MPIKIGGGISVAGNLADNADTDTYTVFLREGEVYDFWLGRDYNSSGGFADAFLTLAGPSAGLPINDDNSGEGSGGLNTLGNATFTFQATATGLHTITAEEVSGNGDGGDYVLTFVNRSFDDDIADHTFFTDATGGIGGGATIAAVGTNAAINVGDVFHSDLNEARPTANEAPSDVIAVFLVDAGGLTYDIDVRGFDSGDGTLANPFVSLLDDDGDLLDFDDDSGAGVNALIDNYDPTYTGWHFIQVAVFNIPSGAGTYEVQVTPSGAAGLSDVPGDNTGAGDGEDSPFNVPLNGAVEGTIDIAGDEDWYAINLVAGATYHFEATRVTLNGSIELVLVNATSGSVVEQTDSDPTTAAFDFTVDAGESGRYFAVVRGDAGTETGTFQLSASLTSAPPAPVHQITAVDDPDIVGSDLTDNITGSPGADSIGGHLGNDTVAGGAGNDTLNGGTSNDAVTPTGDDSLSGDAGNDVINGEDGNDTLDGGSEGDALNGGHGADSMLGGPGDDGLDAGLDTLINTLDGGEGNDLLTTSEGNDLIAGGSGNDTILGSFGSQTVAGGDGDDVFLAFGGGEDLIDGGNGNDVLPTGFGDDTVLGGEGDDTISGGDGTNILNGGNGNDTFLNVDAGDLITAGAGTDHIQSEIGWTLDSDEENLTLLFADNVNGNGNTGGNVIFGNNGANQLSGLGGNDTVNGGAGNDTLIGGFGKDLNTGSGGLDHIKFNALGESGTTFATRDAINTFAHGDKIDLSAIDANTNVAGNQAFIFTSAQALTGLSGLVIAQQVATNSFLVLADVNGDANADFSLNVYTSPGFGTFQAWDFIL